MKVPRELKFSKLEQYSIIQKKQSFLWRILTIKITETCELLSTALPPTSVPHVHSLILNSLCVFFLSLSSQSLPLPLLSPSDYKTGSFSFIDWELWKNVNIIFNIWIGRRKVKKKQCLRKEIKISCTCSIFIFV